MNENVTIGEIVFKDPAELEWLEQLLHPRTRALGEAWLESVDGQSAHLSLEPIGPPIRIRVLKLLIERWFLTPFEIVFQTYEIPLSRFQQINPAFVPAKLARIGFLFNRKHADVVYLDDIGFARPTVDAK